MKKAKVLDFSNKQKKNSKRMKYFVVSFAAFVLVLGTISLLMFMKSVNFDMKNLVSGAKESTTQTATETTTQSVVLSGASQVLVFCNDSSGKISFAFVIKTDMADKSMKVSYIPSDVTAQANNADLSLAEHYQKFGTNGFVNAAAIYSGIKFDRYIRVNETQFKSFVSKIGDVTVNVSSPIDAKTSGGLSLDSGAQSLSADLLLRYIKYADSSEKSAAFSAFLNKTFNTKNISGMDKLYSYLANNSETNISIVDYKNQAEQIKVYIESGGSASELTEVGVNEKKN